MVCEHRCTALYLASALSACGPSPGHCASLEDTPHHRRSLTGPGMHACSLTTPPAGSYYPAGEPKASESALNPRKLFSPALYSCQRLPLRDGCCLWSLTTASGRCCFPLARCTASTWTLSGGSQVAHSTPQAVNISFHPQDKPGTA